MRLTGMIHPNMIMDALTQGWADGVLVCGCHIGDCHYQEGNKKAETVKQLGPSPYKS